MIASLGALGPGGLRAASVAHRGRQGTSEVRMWRLRANRTRDGLASPGDGFGRTECYGPLLKSPDGSLHTLKSALLWARKMFGREPGLVVCARHPGRCCTTACWRRQSTQATQLFSRTDYSQQGSTEAGEEGPGRGETANDGRLACLADADAMRLWELVYAGCRMP